TVLGVLLCCEAVKLLLRVTLDILRGMLEKKELMLFII
ncbi:membrane protein, partial [Escherichia coli O145:H25 str. 07-3858]